MVRVVKQWQHLVFLEAFSIAWINENGDVINCVRIFVCSGEFRLQT
jgi:hypothetical protein